MSDKPITIFLSAAEASGDEHAAGLIRALKLRLPGARFVGVAGPRMAAEGCEVVVDMTAQASMLGGPFIKFWYYLRTIKRIKQAIAEIRPDIHIPVDSPAMNWHLADAARQAGAQVLYFIAPQVWAWAPWRVKKLARLTDAVACILPFEESYLRHRGVNARYVGHPLLDSLPPRPQTLPDIVDAWAHGQWKIALLPGSRKAEIAGHSRALLSAGRAIRRRWPKAVCTFTARDESAADDIRRILAGQSLDGVEIAVGKTREVLAESHFAIAVSGTVTLEVAYFGVPMVIFYRTPAIFRFLHKFIGRWGVPTPFLSLVNILAGRGIVPELMPWNGRVRPLVEMVNEVMDEMGYLCQTRSQLLALTDSLRVPPPQSALGNAADMAVELIKGKHI
jgi:lipid-A-disaccharide synthase